MYKLKLCSVFSRNVPPHSWAYLLSVQESAPCDSNLCYLLMLCALLSLPRTELYTFTVVWTLPMMSARTCHPISGNRSPCVLVWAFYGSSVLVTTFGNSILTVFNLKFSLRQILSRNLHIKIIYIFLQFALGLRYTYSVMMTTTK